MMGQRILIACCLALGFAACTKEDFYTGKDANVRFSRDTLFFDTVFTSVGSVTGGFKIINDNNGKLRLNAVRLMGAATSAYRMNVDGAPGDVFSNIDIDSKDSIWVFATITINPTNANLPFLVRDSIQIIYNDSTRYVQLRALGQNANFYTAGKRITNDTTFTANRPYVFIKDLVVEKDKTLTIAQGCRLYFNAGAQMIVKGTLKVNGDRFDSARVVFRGDRLDEPYKDFPSSWPGIVFTDSSKQNELSYATIKNAYIGLTVIGPLNNTPAPKLKLQQCIVDNMFGPALLAGNTTIDANNCLFLNSGVAQGSTNVQIENGGTYNFNFCNIVGYSNFYIKKNSSLFLGHAANTPLRANFRNTIIFGDGSLPENEILLPANTTSGPSFTVGFANCFYKQKDFPAAITPNTAFVANLAPQFDSINANRRYFDLRFNNAANPPMLNKGIAVAGINVDLDGKPRNVGTAPDIGCYEKQ
jgi:hypothetical protein